jgi:acetylglutamate kinase
VLFLTDVEGWLADRSDPVSLISETDIEEIKHAIDSGAVGGGMLPKLQACLAAVERGVRFAHIVDGREPHSLLLELFTDAGIGTKVRGQR